MENVDVLLLLMIQSDSFSDSEFSQMQQRLRIFLHLFSNIHVNRVKSENQM